MLFYQYIKDKAEHLPPVTLHLDLKRDGPLHKPLRRDFLQDCFTVLDATTESDILLLPLTLKGRFFNKRNRQILNKGLIRIKSPSTSKLESSKLTPSVTFVEALQ